MTTQPTQYCQNCEKHLSQSKIHTHFGYCRRNIKKCQQCGHTFDINYQLQHEQQFHKNTPCQFCKQLFQKSQIQSHSLICTKKNQFCQYCQLHIPFSSFDHHLSMCQSRTKNCQICDKLIINKQYYQHVSHCKGKQKPPFQKKQYQQQKFDIQPKPFLQKKKYDYSPANCQPTNNYQQRSNSKSVKQNNISKELKNKVNFKNKKLQQDTDHLIQQTRQKTNQLTNNCNKPQKKPQKKNQKIQNHKVPSKKQQQQRQNIKLPSKKQTPIQHNNKSSKPNNYKKFEQKNKQFQQFYLPEQSLQTYGSFQNQYRFTPQENFQQHDQQFQKALMNSMEDVYKQNLSNKIPQDCKIQSNDFLTKSFYRDYENVTAQKKALEDFSKKKEVESKKQKK